MNKTAETQQVYTLASGARIPAIGLGVYLSPPGDATVKSVIEALRCGYRQIDTAAFYRNEADVGRGVRESGVSRKQVFVTTKLWNADHGYDSTLRAFDQSLDRLGLEWVDLYLIHWPVEGKRLESWKALVQIQKSGRAKHIGVSNYTPRHLDELLQSSSVCPEVNQVECSPFLQQRELRAYCEKKNILIQAYSPLTKGERLKDLGLANLAKKQGKSPAQICLRWCLEAKTLPLPKSNNPKRIKENFEVFDFKLDAEDMNALSKLDVGLHTSWDPTDA